MIPKFNADTALLMIDAQRGVDDLRHWGGPNGRRNNPDAEKHQAMLLEAWRDAALPVVHTRHDSREAASPLKWSLASGEFKPGLEARDGELVIRKDVNSGFIGTALQLELLRRGVSRLVVAGFFTNFCVETTVRMAGNLGYDTYLVQDACAATNRIGPDGRDHDPQQVHDFAVASMHGEFCTAIYHQQAQALLRGDAGELQRNLANE